MDNSDDPTTRIIEPLPELRTRVLALAEEGFLMGLLKLQVHLTDDVLHSTRNAACTASNPDSEFGTIELDAVLDEDFAACDTCLGGDHFRPERDRRPLSKFLDIGADLFARLQVLEDPLASFADQLTAARRVDHARMLCRTHVSLLTPELEDRIDRARALLETRRRTPEGQRHALEACVEILVPDWAKHSTLDPSTRVQITDLIAAQRAAVLASPSWVLAAVLEDDLQVEGLQSRGVSAVMEIFTKDLVMSAPAMVYDACQALYDLPHVVLPERPSDELVETVRGIYDRTGLGPYAELENAVAAARTLL